MSAYLSNLKEKLTAEGSEERRVWVRHICKLDGSCQPVSEDRSEDRWPARVRDVSEGGVGLFLNRRFEIGTLLILELPSSNGSAPHLYLVRVIRLVHLAKDKWFLGCTLNPEIDNEDVKTLVEAAGARAKAGQ